MGLLLLLVENGDADGSLENHFPAVAYTLQTATHAEAARHALETLWPDAVLVNCPSFASPPLELMDQLSQNKFKIPCFAVMEAHQATHAEWHHHLTHVITLPYTAEQVETMLAQWVDPHRFLRFGKLILDMQRKELLREAEVQHLTPKLFQLLNLLMSHADQTVSRKQIMKEVWQTDYLGDTRTLDVHIRWIRERIEADPSRPKHLCTVRGTGYRFVSQPAATESDSPQ
jgi:DNA-binding response OmpR family regulator